MPKDLRKAVLITGAAGFVGGECVREFLRRGWRVTALVHRSLPPELAAMGEAGALSIVRGSIEDGPGLRLLLAEARARQGEGFDAVVHCAALASDIGRDSRFRKANYEGTRNLVDCVLQLPIGRLVFLSTTDVYGLLDFRGADEETSCRATLGNPYPRYKILAEQHIRNTLPPERYAILRPAAVWGPGDTTILPRILAFLRKAPAVVHFGKWKGRNRWPLAYIRNVSAAAFLASEREEALGRPFNVLDEERTSIDEFYRMLLAIYFPERLSLRSLTLPFALGWAVGALSSGISNLLGRDRPLFDPSLYGLYSVSRDLDFSGDRMVALFRAAGERPVGREEAREEFASWARAQKT